MWTGFRPCCRRSLQLLRARQQQALALRYYLPRHASSSAQAEEREEIDAGELAHLGQSPQLRSLLAGPSKRANVVVKRPTHFKKPGLARDLLKYLSDFPHALLLCRVGQFYEVRQARPAAPQNCTCRTLIV